MITLSGAGNNIDRRIMIMTTIALTTMIVIVLIISARYVISRYLEEWREVDIDNIEKMRNCACYKCKHMIELWEEYLCYSE